MKPQRCLYCLTLLLLSLPCFTQEIGINTNFLYWSTTTPNAGIEVAVNKKITIDIQGAYNPWMFSNKEENKKLKHWVVQTEVRYWNCERFAGSFWGIHAHYGQYNMAGMKLPFNFFQTLEDHRYEGWFAGGGITYGYQWYLSPRWNLQALIGVGYTYNEYKKFECHRCGEFLKSGQKHYVGPTKAAISLIYFIKTKK